MMERPLPRSTRATIAASFAVVCAVAGTLAGALAFAPAVLLAQRGPAKPAGAPVVTTSQRNARRLVIVDAGHGGEDNGMRGRLPDGSSVYEKNINLSIAKKLADELKRRGFDVLMTRTRDTLIALADRGRIANSAHGDLFISIHVNAPGPGEPKPSAMRGFETYFLAEAKTEEERRVESMENDAVRFETTVTPSADDPLAFIIKDLAQNEHLRDSSEFANTIQLSLMHSHPGPSRGVKQANFSVLRNAYMPAVLVETGFGTNGAEAYWLSSDSGQREIAACIADATVDYLHNYDRRIGAFDQR